MLTLTDTAAEVVAKITEQNITAEEAGLRISQSGTADEPSLALSPVDAPKQGDQTIVEGSARVFLDANAATRRIRAVRNRRAGLTQPPAHHPRRRLTHVGRRLAYVCPQRPILDGLGDELLTSGSPGECA